MIDRRRFVHAVSASFASAAVFGSASAAQRSAAADRSNGLLKPKKLSAGDTVGLVLPATMAFEADRVHLAKEQLEEIGFRVVTGRHAFDKHGYFAGADRDRAADLNRMFADPGIDGIFCFTGGWGTPRILPLLDYGLIRKNPKALIGFSDITALLNAIHQRTGLVTFHGPVADTNLNPYTLENFRRVVMSDEPAGDLSNPPKAAGELVSRKHRILRITGGKATGRLAGGNLTLLSATMGTPYEIDTDGAILLLEDVDEALYRIDRMLTQLWLGGKFDRLAGVAFGRCTECPANGPAFSLEELLRERFGSLGIPAIAGLAFGHIEDKLTLPIGLPATLDAYAGTLRLTESAVHE